MQSVKLIKKQTFALRLEKGEKLYEKLLDFCNENNLNYVDFYGIGALENIDYGVYENNEYVRFNEPELTELTSIIGNVSFLDRERMIHSHANFSKLGKDGEVIAFSGHVFEAVVSVTVELIINAYDNKINRKFDSEVGLNLLDLSS